MKPYNLDGTEINIQEFGGDSVVVIRVTKEMNEEEWANFRKNTEEVAEIFYDKGMQVVLCPDWAEFKEWK